MSQPDPRNINNQVNQPFVNRDFVVEGDVILYQEKKIPRQLTRLPGLREKLIGRVEDLQNLTTTLADQQTVALVRGMGGVGKTTLATAYLDQERSKLHHAVWITQTADFTTSLLASDILRHALEIELTDNPDFDAKLLLQRLASLSGPSLLIIDNAEPDVNDFLDYLPGGPDWKVLITTRGNIKTRQQIKLKNLTEAEATALFYEHYHLAAEEEQVKQLIHDLGGHALTIELLAKTAQNRQLPLANFLEKLVAKDLSAINRRAEDVDLAHDRNGDLQRVFPYLVAVFDLSGLTEEDQHLLYRFTILPPDFVALDLLAQVFAIDRENEDQWDDFTLQLNRLANAGWLLYDPKQGYRLHRVMADVVRFTAREEPKSKQPLLDEVLDNISKYVSFDRNSAQNPALMVAELAFGEAVEEQLRIAEVSSEIHAYFLDRLATLLAVFGRYAEAATLFEAALAANLAQFGDQHSTVQTRRSNLAIVYRNLGRHAEAAKLLETALKYEIEQFGDQHPEVQASRSNLATVYRNLGRYDEAAKLLETALKYGIEQFGDQHLEVQASQSNLANVYRDLGRHAEAAKLLETALKYGIERFGDQHPNVQIRRSNLATVYRNLGRHNEAAKLVETALKYGIEQLGDQHPNVQISRSNLANVYGDLGRYDEAAKLLETALKYGIEQFGDQHPEVQASRSNLANVYGNLGRHDEAAKLLETALKYDLEQFGDQHPTVQTMRSNLAIVYGDLGRHDEAAQLLETALKYDLEQFGDQHPTVQISRINIASNLYQQGKFAEALSYIQPAYTNLLARFGETHPHVKIALSWLNSIKEKLGS